MKVGLELEYWVIDREGELSSAEEISEELDFAEQEFVEPLLELKTQPHEDLEELEEEIYEKVSETLQIAEENGLGVVPLGTPLNSGDIEKISSRRGQIQEEIVGENLEAAKRVAGTHIHFEKENVKNQLNILTALDPALALLNSSPYYQGGHLGSSSRNEAYRYKCYQDFPKHGQLWSYIDSVDEWEERIDQRFKEFKKAAEKAGISEKEVEEHFSAEDALWTPVRLRYNFPTVEWRAPDTTTPSQAVKLVKEIKPIVKEAARKGADEEIKTVKFAELKDLSRNAIIEGLENEEVSQYLSELGFSTEEYLDTSEKWRREEELTRDEASEIRLAAAREFKEFF